MSLKRSYDLSATKDQREIRDKMPTVDDQIHPDGTSSASLVISIINRADINIAPLDIKVERSFDSGDLYLSSAQQSLNKLQSSISLQAMGTIAPKGIDTTEATMSVATNGNSYRLKPWQSTGNAKGCLLQHNRGRCEAARRRQDLRLAIRIFRCSRRRARGRLERRPIP
jgi:hypothetical protein